MTFAIVLGLLLTAAVAVVGLAYVAARDLLERRAATLPTAGDDLNGPTLERMAVHLGRRRARGHAVDLDILRHAVEQRMRARTSLLVGLYGWATTWHASALVRRDHAGTRRERAADALVEVEQRRPDRPLLSPIGGPVVHTVLLLALFTGEAFLAKPTFLALLDSDLQAWILAGLFAVLLMAATETSGRALDAVLTERRDAARRRLTIGVGVTGAVVLVLSVLFVASMAGSREHNKAYIDGLRTQTKQPLALPSSAGPQAPAVTPAPVPGAAPTAPSAPPATPQQSPPAAAPPQAPAPAQPPVTIPAAPAGGAGEQPKGGAQKGNESQIPSTPPADGSFGGLPAGAVGAVPAMLAAVTSPDLSFALFAQVLGIFAGLLLVVISVRCAEWHEWSRDRRRVRWESRRAMFAERGPAARSLLRRAPQMYIEGRVRAIADEELQRGRRLERGARIAARDEADALVALVWPTADEYRDDLLGFARLTPDVAEVNVDPTPRVWPFRWRPPVDEPAPPPPHTARGPNGNGPAGMNGHGRADDVPDPTEFERAYREARESFERQRPYDHEADAPVAGAEPVAPPPEPPPSARDRAPHSAVGSERSDEPPATMARDKPVVAAAAPAMARDRERPGPFIADLMTRHHNRHGQATADGAVRTEAEREQQVAGNGVAEFAESRHGQPFTGPPPGALDASEEVLR